MRPLLIAALLPLLADAAPHASPGNRLAYLDAPADPYYVGTGFAKLATPQWVGEPGVEAVAVLSIDDMREPEKYERYLRPVLDTLKPLTPDGRAPLTVFTCTVDPAHPQLQAWLAEGVNVDVHTTNHPCPLLDGNGDIAPARDTVHACIDLLTQIPNHAPLTYRMPCCDSMNSLSPRFFTDIFTPPTGSGHFLAADSSVFTVFDATPEDKARFSKYVPRLRGYVGFTKNYPFPYVINNNAWELPCTVPSDWEAQDRHGVNNPETVTDLARAIDITVAQAGLFNFVFHPHGWIENTQVAGLVRDAKARHGDKLRFLNLHDCVERLTANALGGHPLRKADGSDNGVRLLDLDNDGFMDVVIGNDQSRQTRLWQPASNTWKTLPLPVTIDSGSTRFAVLQPDKHASLIAGENLYHFTPDGWQPAGKSPVAATPDTFLRALDIDGDGVTELVSPHNGQVSLHSYRSGTWKHHTFRWAPDFTPHPVATRFVDLDQDGDLDLVHADGSLYAVHLFESKATGWGLQGLAGERGSRDPAVEIPPFIRADGSHNGAFFTRSHLYLQNEDTGKLNAQVERRAFSDIVRNPDGILDSKPVPADKALSTMRTTPGLTVELVAAEPLVADPVNFAWGADGSLWVAEMADYPDAETGGRVRTLRDLDLDGTPDVSLTFLEDIPFPTGVFPWRDGCLVLTVPDLIFARDNDGDGTADERETLFTGFKPGNQQHRANGFTWSLDGWIVLANGDSGGTVTSVKTGKSVDIRGRDLRVKPDTGEIELLTGMTQYGRTRDDHGNWFGCNNFNPMWHIALEDRYLARNPHYAAPDTTVDLVTGEGRPPVFPVAPLLERFNDFHTANRITSACGLAVYRDLLLGDAYYGNPIVCEPVHNLVHRRVLEPVGTTFKARRAPQEQQSEILASTDPWSRPVFARTGPDGALYVADMVRLVIEHPEWIPDEWQQKLGDLRAGHELGRIYRLVPENAPLRKIPDLTGLDTPQLVAQLNSPNGTVRDLAHQLIIERDDPGAISHLKTLTGPLAHIHALYLLDHFGQPVTPSDLDASPEVRRHAVSLTRSSALLTPFLADPDPHVRLQVALALGDIRERPAGNHLAKMLLATEQDGFVRAAALSSALPHLATLLARAPTPEIIRITAAAGQDNPAAIRDAMATFIDSPPAERFPALTAFLDNNIEVAPTALDPALTEARALQTPDAITLLGAARRPADIPRLISLLAPGHAPGTTNAALDALSRYPTPEVATAITNALPALTSETRTASLALLTTRPAWTRHLLENLPAELDPALRSRLLEHPDESIRTLANQKLAAPSPRADVIAGYTPHLDKPGNIAEGRTIFRQLCIACHALEGHGQNIGPDLAALTDRSAEALLTAVLDPNAAVEDKYRTAVATTNDGRTLVGTLTNESATAVTLATLDGRTHTLLRTAIKSLTITPKSLMPEAFEYAIPPTQMPHLLAYLAAAK